MTNALKYKQYLNNNVKEFVAELARNRERFINTCKFIKGENTYLDKKKKKRVHGSLFGHFLKCVSVHVGP